jgi:hypothetical protein
MKNKLEVQLHFSITAVWSVGGTDSPPELLCGGGVRIYGLAVERRVEARRLLVLFPFICRQEINNTERCNCRYFGLQMKRRRC